MMVPSVLLLYFSTQVLQLPFALGSMIILVPKVVIIFVDPLIGRFSDRLQTPLGGRAPLMLAGAIISPLMFVAMFSVAPTSDPHLTFALELGAYLVASMAYSLFGVPFIALPAEMDLTPKARARLLALRVALYFLGMVIGAAAAPALAAFYGGGSGGYRAMGLALAPFLAGIMGLAVIGALTPRRSERLTPAGRRRRVRFADLLRSPSFSIPMAVNFTALTAMSAFMAGSPYFVSFGLRASASATSVLVAAQLLAAFVSMVFWSRRLTSTGVRASLILALSLAAFGAAATSLFGHFGLFGAVLAGAGLFGAGLGGAQVAGQAALAEAIKRAEVETGQGRGGQMTGLWTASERIAYALGPAATSVILSLGGFVGGRGLALQSPVALEAARLTIVVGPCVFLSLGLCFAYVHPILRTFGKP